MKITSEVKAGIFLLLAIIILFSGIWILGQKREVFSSKEGFNTSFSDVQGLTGGAPIRLSGISIGRVDSINFPSDPRDSNVLVRLLINKEYLPRLNIDSTVSIQTQGLLGDKFISITPGKSNEILPIGANIRSMKQKDIAESLQEAGLVISNISKVSGELVKLVAEFRSSTLDGLTKTSNNMAKITSEIVEGKGLLNKMIFSKEDGKKISDLINNLNETAKGLKNTTDSLAEGSGTLGALLMDSSLYDNMVEITDDTKRSFILKKAIKASINNK